MNINIIDVEWTKGCPREMGWYYININNKMFNIIFVSILDGEPVIFSAGSAEHLKIDDVENIVGYSPIPLPRFTQL